jgi:hypothetical protein
MSAKPTDTALRSSTKAVAGRQHRHCQPEAGKPQGSQHEERQERAPGVNEAH